MNVNEIKDALIAVKEARAKWDTARAKFESDVQYMMTRLINESVAQYMSAEDIAAYSGFTAKRVRLFMRIQRLDPKGGKRALSKIAADTLRTNALIMGIEPRDMDLMSPLAYLPMGKQMREEFLETEAARSGVHEVPAKRLFYENDAGQFVPVPGQTVTLDAEHYEALEDFVRRSEGIAPVSVESLVGMALDGFIKGADEAGL